MAFLAEQRKHPGVPILPTLRLMAGGGAPKPPEVHFEVRDEIGGRGVVHGYGMTEVPMIANGSPRTPTSSWPTPTGARSTAPTCASSPSTAAAAAGEEGEVRVRGPMVCHGYTDPALDADGVRRRGYFRTGDLGRCDDGHLCITGRLKDVIIRKGENVSAKEVENVLYRTPRWPRSP